MKKSPPSFVHFIFVLIIFGLLSGCNQPRQFLTTPTNDGTVSVATQILSQATDTQIAKTQTATTIPAALSVNGINYPLEYFKEDLLRFMMVFPEMNPEQSFETLITDLSEQLILFEAAVENGFNISEQELDQRIAGLADDVGGEEALANWLSNNYYTQSSFRYALNREVAVAFQKQYIFDQIPTEVDQVELYQILVYDESTAKQIGQALAEGSDFFWLAEQYHPATKGYLGWNPKGAMLPIKVEEMAFALEVNTYSDILQTEYGYHILYLNNREVHELSPANLLFLQKAALEQWMADQLTSASITINVSPEE